MKENLDKLKGIINSLEINTIVNIEADKLSIVNGNLYIYLINDNSIKIYDCQIFKEIANLRLPFKRKKLKFEILENEIVIMFADLKLYFYKINIKENKLDFMHYLSEVYNFCYLKKRKEILLLTELGSFTEKIVPWGMAKSDLLGNITFANKIKPKIYYEFTSPKSIEQFTIPTHVQSTEKYFCEWNGFNDDKYIINISGYIYDWYDYKISWGDTEIRFDISIFNADNLNELLDENHEEDLEYCKITDNLFKFVSQKSSFYYNEKDNKIEYIDNLFNYINKAFGLTYQKQKEKKKKYLLNEDHEQYDNKNNQKIKYFYLNDNMFAVFDGKYYLYIVNLSTGNNIVKRIELNWFKEYYNPDIKNIIYCKSDENEYLYLSFMAKNKKTGKIRNQIIYGKIY